ncbi:MAG: FAD/NAD(P)-binding protein [bacterium]|nr:FAD/NAD(P)-binding protein [bacterium]
MQNPYKPYPVRIRRIIIENDTRDLKTFELVFLNKEDEECFRYTPGQFAELSVYGAGESPIGIASSPTEKGFIKFTVKKMGVVTTALHNMEEGQVIGIRGPYGNWYPFHLMEGKDIVVIGGGFAFTTLRSAIVYMLHGENRKRFGKITCIYGARNAGELIYKPELKEWEERSDIDMYVTVDKLNGDPWPAREGFVPAVTKEIAPSSENSICLVCGPQIMIKFTIPVLTELGFPPDRIINSLEMRMKCGIGKCGRCNIGNRYVCKDGPIFSLAQLNEMPDEY